MKKLLLLLTTISVISACKKDDNTPPPPNPTVTHITCKVLAEKLTDATGVHLTTYHYTGDSLDSISYPPEIGTYVSIWYDSTERTQFLKCHIIPGDLYLIYNEYGDLYYISLSHQGPPIEKIRQFRYGHNCSQLTASGKEEYCQIITSDVWRPNSSETITTTYYYTGNRIDSAKYENTFIKYTSTGTNKYKVEEYESGIPKDGYSIEEYNDYNRPTSITRYDKNNTFIDQVEFTYSCK